MAWATGGVFQRDSSSQASARDWLGFFNVVEDMWELLTGSRDLGTVPLISVLSQDEQRSGLAVMIQLAKGLRSAFPDNSSSDENNVEDENLDQDKDEKSFLKKVVGFFKKLFLKIQEFEKRAWEYLKGFFSSMEDEDVQAFAKMLAFFLSTIKAAHKGL